MSAPPLQDADDPYARIARWYDLEHDQFDDDVQFYLDLAAGAGPEILEVGCGTGRVTVALARSGRRVTGVDRSAAMLARAHARLAAEPSDVRARIRLCHADARALGEMVTDRFSLALLPLNTLAHMVTATERLSLLEAVRGRLVAGGRLIVDVDLQGPRRLLDPPGQVFVQGIWPVPPEATAPAEADIVTVIHFVTGRAGKAGDDLVCITHLYDAQERGGIVRRTMADMTLALLTRGEVEVTLEHAGFAVESVYGTYDLDNYTAGADRAIFVAHSV